MKCRNITFRYIGSISISCYWCWWHHHIVSSPPLCSKVITVIALTIKCGAHFNLILQIVPELNEFNLKGVSLLLFLWFLSVFHLYLISRLRWCSGSIEAVLRERFLSKHKGREIERATLSLPPLYILCWKPIKKT